MEIELSFVNYVEEKYNHLEKVFTDISENIFKHLDLDDYFIFDVSLVDLNKIHEINRDYRNIDRPTDVISFAFEDSDDFTFVQSNNKLPRNLGEIIICIDKALEQAKEYNHSFEREISFLFTHGLLHLLGYDHMENEDEKVMFKIQDEIMEILGL